MTKPVYPMEELVAFAVQASKQRLNDEEFIFDVYVSEMYTVVWDEDENDLGIQRTLTLEGAQYVARTHSPDFYVIAYQGKVVEQWDNRPRFFPDAQNTASVNSFEVGRKVLCIDSKTGAHVQGVIVAVDFVGAQCAVCAFNDLAWAVHLNTFDVLHTLNPLPDVK